MGSDWVDHRQHLLLDFHHDAPASMARISPVSPLPQSAPLPFPGQVVNEHHNADEYSAEIEVSRNSYLLFKETWHGDWRALVDGEPELPVMLSPGFVGVPVTPGHHQVVLRYQAQKWQAILAGAGLLIALILIVGERRWPFPEIIFPHSSKTVA